MMLLGQVHLPAQFTIPLLLLIAAGIAWYWLRLGRADVPSSRRRIRRISAALMMLSLPMLGKALSFVDPDVPAEQQSYVMSWTIVLLFVVAIVVTAALDILNNVRLLHASRVEEMHDAAARLREAMHNHRANSPPQRSAASPSQPSESSS